MVLNKLLTNDTVLSTPEFENNYIPNSRVDGRGIETYALLPEKDNRGIIVTPDDSCYYSPSRLVFADTHKVLSCQHTTE